MLNLYPDLDQFKGFKLQTAGKGEVKCFSAVPTWYSTDLERTNDRDDDSDGGMDFN